MLVLNILLLSYAVSEEYEITPCQRAEYDVEHSIIRTPEMLSELFETEKEIAEYTDCYDAFMAQRFGEENGSEQNVFLNVCLGVVIVGVVLILLTGGLDYSVPMGSGGISFDLF